MATEGPPMEFDGHIYWYLDHYDPADDRCCVCRLPIPEDDVPLVLFKTRGRETLMARMHMTPCADRLLEAGHLTVQKH